MSVFAEPLATDSAVIVVDPQRDFCEKGAVEVPGARKIFGACNYMMGCSENVFVSRDWHPLRTDHFKIWPEHCIAQTIGAEFHPDLTIPSRAVIIAKGQGFDDTGYSAFEGVNYRHFSLDWLLINRKVRKLYVMGLATDYCVKATVLEGLKRHYEVEVMLDGIAAVNLFPSDGGDALQAMRDAGATLECAGRYGYLGGKVKAYYPTF